MNPWPAFILPYAVVLAVPAALCWWTWFRHGPGRWWRALALALLVCAATGPEWSWGRGGSDVVLVLDRSASMPGDERARQEELVRLVAEQRGPGDRLAVVNVAAGAVCAQAPSASGWPRLADHAVVDDASELAAGLDLAASLIPARRSARVILHSDGEDTGPDAGRAVARLAIAGIPVDVLPATRPEQVDVAVARIEVPAQVRLGESFIGAAQLVSEVRCTRRWRVCRGSTVIADGTVALTPQAPSLITFADRPNAAGLADYGVELLPDGPPDRQPRNDRARAVVRVGGGERVLVLGHDGQPGNVVRALVSAGLDAVARRPDALRLGDLLGASAVVLDDVPADRIGVDGLTALGRWVEHLGGGLVMLGGRSSFGLGGYRKSPVERVLPVTLELRDEHRAFPCTLVMVLDVSGSMSARCNDGRMKLELANEGVASAIEMLNSRDRVAVLAVDSVASTVIGMQTVDHPEALARQALGIQPGGYGIFLHEALAQAARTVLTSPSGTRHIVLFADADHIVEPGDYAALEAQLRQAGITVSVIGLGNDRDQYADLLMDVAQRGGGRCTFAALAEDIPRLFSQETLLVARSSWIDGAAPMERQPGLPLVLGNHPSLQAAWPVVPGYNLTYVRPEATVLALAKGDPVAPAVASWRIGTGRSAALCLACDDATSASMLGWSGYAPLLAGLTRWVAGGEDGQALGQLGCTRHGRTAVVRLELDPARRGEWPATPPRLTLVGEGADAPAAPLLQPVEDGVWEATLTLKDDRVVVPTVSLAGRPVTGPPLCLPCPPEVEPRLGRTRGGDVLAGIARQSGGRLRRDLLGCFDNPASPGGIRPLAPWLVVAALLALLAEIAWRRLHLPHLPIPRWSWPRWRRGTSTVMPVRGPRAMVPADPSPVPPVAGAEAPPAPMVTPPAAPPLTSTGGMADAMRRISEKRKP